MDRPVGMHLQSQLAVGHATQVHRRGLRALQIHPPQGLLAAFIHPGQVHCRGMGALQKKGGLVCPAQAGNDQITARSRQGSHLIRAARIKPRHDIDRDRHGHRCL